MTLAMATSARPSSCLCAGAGAGVGDSCGGGGIASSGNALGGGVVGHFCHTNLLSAVAMSPGQGKQVCRKAGAVCSIECGKKTHAQHQKGT